VLSPTKGGKAGSSIDSAMRKLKGRGERIIVGENTNNGGET